VNGGIFGRSEHDHFKLGRVIDVAQILMIAWAVLEVIYPRHRSTTVH
jgi:hypothetical protein